MRVDQTNTSSYNRQEPVALQNKQRTLVGKLVDGIENHPACAVVLGCALLTSMVFARYFFALTCPCDCPEYPPCPLESDPLAPNCNINQMRKFDYAKCDLKKAYLELQQKSSDGNGFVISLFEGCYDCNQNDIREVLNQYVDDELERNSANSYRRITNLAHMCLYKGSSTCDSVVPKIFEALINRNSQGEVVQIVTKCVDRNLSPPGCQEVIKMAPGMTTQVGFDKIYLNDDIRMVFYPSTL